MKVVFAAAFAAMAMAGTTASAAKLGVSNAPLLKAPVAQARPVESGATCLNDRPVSHVNYMPDTSIPVRGCGHLLSTDAIVRDNHWNKT